ncbi:MAG: MFS transporter [Actinobacteria bacterium]|nr:MFS transporter [Actinomycetota bacterium]
MFRSLAVRNYRIWFMGALVSNVGAWMQATAQNWVVLTELSDNDAVAVGITMSLQFGPQLLLVPISGTVADRFDRRKVLFVTQTLLMLLALGLGVLLISGHAQLWHLYCFALGLGIVNAFDTPARQAYVSDLVQADQLSNAVALNSASFNSARLIGPAVAGVLIAVIGSGWVFVINAVSFIAMLVALWLIRTVHEPTPASGRESQLGQLVAGFRYVVRRRDLLVICIMVFVIGAFGMNFPIFSSTMAVEFGRGAGEYGLLSSILAIGSLAGALMVAKRPAARFRAVVMAGGGFGISCTIAALMPTFWTFAATLVLLGYCTSTMLSTANGFVQTTSEPRVRGRVLSIYFAILMGGTPLGAPIVGAVSDALGPRWGLGVAALSGFVAFGVGIGWLIIARGLRVHLRADGGHRIAVTHTGRPGLDDDPTQQSETLTAPITVLRRGPVILSDPSSAPQSGALSEGLTGPIAIIGDDPADDVADDPADGPPRPRENR